MDSTQAIEASQVQHETDAELIAASRLGSSAAWRQLVERYQRLVFTVARRHRLGEGACGDVFEGVFAELWHSLARIEHPQQVRAWLVTVARRQSLAYLEHQRRWVSLSDPMVPIADPSDPAPAAEALLLEAEQEEAMGRALGTLSPRCRQLLEWLFFADPTPSYAEIGRRLIVSPNSVGFIRGRCLEKLKTALAAEMGEERAQGVAAGGSETG